MSSLEAYRCAFLLGPGSLEIRTLPAREPDDGEVLLRVDAATTCGTDVKVYRRGGHPRMMQPPSPFGHEVAGTVVAVGSAAAGWRPGDRVVVANSASCGRCTQCEAGRQNLCADLLYLNGGFADFLNVPRRFVERSLHSIPDSLTSPVAALAEPLACVLHGVERTPLGAPGRVLVVGGGPIGQMFVQVLSLAGHDVTLADPHRERITTAIHLGASATVQIGDRRELVAEIDQATGGAFVATIDTTGSPEGWTALPWLTQPGGTVNFFGGCKAGVEISIDATRVHYDELTLVGSYHHRPPTFAAALEHLAGPGAELGRLISDERPLEALESALIDMMSRRVIKVAIRPDSG